MKTRFFSKFRLYFIIILATIHLTLWLIWYINNLTFIIFKNSVYVAHVFTVHANCAHASQKAKYRDLRLRISLFIWYNMLRSLMCPILNFILLNYAHIPYFEHQMIWYKFCIWYNLLMSPKPSILFHLT